MAKYVLTITVLVLLGFCVLIAEGGGGGGRRGGGRRGGGRQGGGRQGGNHGDSSRRGHGRHSGSWSSEYDDEEDWSRSWSSESERENSESHPVSSESLDEDFEDSFEQQEDTNENTRGGSGAEGNSETESGVEEHRQKSERNPDGKDNLDIEASANAMLLTDRKMTTTAPGLFTEPSMDREWTMDKKKLYVYITAAVIGSVAVAVIAVIAVIICCKSKKTSYPSKVGVYEDKSSKDQPPAYDCTDLEMKKVDLSYVAPVHFPMNQGIQPAAPVSPPSYSSINVREEGNAPPKVTVINVTGPPPKY